MTAALFARPTTSKPWLYTAALLVAMRANPSLADPPASANDEKSIRHILDQSCLDMGNGKIGGTTWYFQPDIIVYDLVPPLISDAAHVQQGNIQLLAKIDGHFSCTYEDIQTRMLGPGYAFTASIIYAHAKLKSGGAVALRMRSTDIWQKTTAGWRAVHEHTSLPFDPATGKALLMLPMADAKR